MDLLDHSEMNEEQLTTARKYATVLNALGADIDAALAKHGFSNMRFQNLCFANQDSGEAVTGPGRTLGVGVTRDGIWEIKIP